MNRKERIAEDLSNVFRSKVGISELPSLEAELLADLELDSIQLLTLIVEIENRFRICLDVEDEQSLSTVGDLIQLIEHHLAQTGDPQDQRNQDMRPGSEDPE